MKPTEFSDDDDGEFILLNPLPRKPRFKIEPEKQRQTMLLSGLDCLPGQTDFLDDETA